MALIWLRLARIDGDMRFVNAAGGNFYLQGSSGAIDTGVTLSDVPNDYAGVPRPNNGLYDIGAYEYVVSSAPPLSAPVNLRISP